MRTRPRPDRTPGLEGAPCRRAMWPGIVSERAHIGTSSDGREPPGDELDAWSARLPGDTNLNRCGGCLFGDAVSSNCLRGDSFGIPRPRSSVPITCPIPMSVFRDCSRLPLNSPRAIIPRPQAREMKVLLLDTNGVPILFRGTMR